MSAIELADFRALGPSARAAAGRAVALARGRAAARRALAFLVAPRRASAGASAAPAAERTGIVVVDVSASISWDTYARIATTLDGCAAAAAAPG